MEEVLDELADLGLGEVCEQEASGAKEERAELMHMGPALVLFFSTQSSLKFLC